MKRMILCVLLLLALTGCGFLRETSYVSITPHDEDYDISADSNVLTVTSYLSLKNALLNMVEDGVAEGVIRAESYSGTLSEDLSMAVREVTEVSPLGAYAVESMTYDYSKIVSYYEIHVNTTFRRTKDEIQSVTYVTDMDALKNTLASAMKTYSSDLVLRVGYYETIDLSDVVQEIYVENPEYVLELPEVTMELYPDSGTQRIAEIHLSYTHSQEELTEAQAELEAWLDDIEDLFRSASSDQTNARRFFNRLGRDTLLKEQSSISALSDGVYGLVSGRQTTSYGFAQAYCLLLNDVNIPCQLVTGEKNDMPHYWCLVELDGENYYVDPSLSILDVDNTQFLMGDQELDDNGYVLLEDLPAVTLPQEE
jgi:hypothetical protein